MRVDRPHQECLGDSTGKGAPAPALTLRPVRGRKRFTADLSELKAHPELVARSGHWSVKSVDAGDEEASLQVVLVNAEEGRAQAIILVVSDSSQYPDEHTYFGYSLDAGALESSIANVIDKLSTKVGRTLRQVLESFVEDVSRGGQYEGDDESETDEEEEEADGMMSDDDFERSSYQVAPKTSQLSLEHLKKDFLEAQAAGYDPGVLWTGANRFILSVSVPTADLFPHIPPHALFAWDRHFLEPGNYLTLLISGFTDVYPVSQQALSTSSALKFKVGFTQRYKPSVHNAADAFREFFLRHNDGNGGTSAAMHRSDMMGSDPDPGAFRRMSLSASLESLLNQQLLRLLQFRQRFNLGWAGAEELLWQTETTQQESAAIFQQKREALDTAQSEEKKLSLSNGLLSDALDSGGSETNMLKIAFSFLLRRLALSTRHCVVCHKRFGGYEALRPYVCNSGLCVFQYYSLNLGPSVEHEIITNTGAVDLLVSLAYVAAAEDVLDEPLPRGMGLRVQRPEGANVQVDDNGLCELDSLDLEHMRVAIKELLASLPPITCMKAYLERQYSIGNAKVQLRDIDPEVLPAAWSVLRWCVASCTAHIQELTRPEDRLRNLGNYRQFRFLVGAPDKEKSFRGALPRRRHPTLFAFHGSALKNWHSIIRHGLWVKDIVNGRSQGHGVYFSQEASVSLAPNYARPSPATWKNSKIRPVTCCTLAEIVNRRNEFVCGSGSYLVVDKTDWIMCRYLLVHANASAEKGSEQHVQPSSGPSLGCVAPEEPRVGKYLVQEQHLAARLGNTQIDVPQPSYQLDKLVKNCVSGREKVIFEAEDRAIFDGRREEPSGSGSNQSSSPAGGVWVSSDKWIRRNAEMLLPPPTESSPAASTALQREFRSMMREQNAALGKNDLATLGWYLPRQHNEDNLYQWLVELHSFDPDLPIARDMKSAGVGSIAMEIRFPPSFPHAPPFFRVIRPRFRPFAEGGGGHVTVGGSICMDLLTSDGWLPSYSVSALLLQIRLAISSTTPFPARLQKDWHEEYTPDEALQGYFRAARLHDWKITNEGEIRKLVTMM